MQIDAVIFDYYGTLVTIAEQRRSLWASIIERHGLSMSTSKLDRQWLATAPIRDDSSPQNFVPLIQEWERRAGHLFTTLDLDEDAKRFADAYNSVHANAQVYEDITSNLSLIQSAWRTALLSDADASHLLASLDNSGLSFEVVCYSEQLRRYKPAAECFQQVSSELGVELSKCVYIGDSPKSDVNGSHNAGMLSVWLNRDKAQWPNNLRPPRVEIASLADLPTALKSL